VFLKTIIVVVFEKFTFFSLYTFETNSLKMQMKIVFFLGMLLAGANAAVLLESRVSQLRIHFNILDWRRES
jgi:hypothetical protein